MKIHIIGCSGSGKTYLANALSKKYNNDEWIIEGVYYAWVQQFFDEADKIYVLDIPSYLYKSRIIMRSIKRKLGMANVDIFLKPSVVQEPEQIRDNQRE